MISDNVRVKPETRNHQGYFILEASYMLMDIDQNGWALICIDESSCQYVDPDALRMPKGWKATAEAEVAQAAVQA
ncbi:hypothetical protein [Leptolyngbya sp. FACHB-261]|uniref:hypothetical protein n=1 Tax=Leptolyngbya sp. FACHB-261 TaxID=2692806 RepID=UPI0016897E75|nr:hypothetical protein [Leptolyngbya sp. FACHB-261]MBD2102608.1 hypothetical protein [Leptolyngbya sp. FACHB-261]